MSAQTFSSPAVVSRRSVVTGAAAAAGAATLAVGTATQASALTQTKRRYAYKTARTREGYPYVYGATGPYAFDCSGLTKWAYAKHGITLPRSAAQQYRRATGISRYSATLGDMLFVGDYSYASHVGFYVPWNGVNYIFHAPRPGRKVSVDRIWTWRYATRRFY